MSFTERNDKLSYSRKFFDDSDTFQLTKVQEAIRQLSSRCHTDERKIASLVTENKMLREEMTMLQQ